MKVFALSSSRVGNGNFLEHALPYIQEFIGNGRLNIAFIPFASVQKNYYEFGEMVKEALKSLPYTINVITKNNSKSILESADVIMVGGGNTFKLLNDIYEQNLLQLIQNKIKNGTPYIGWSAGANITGWSISTTNDMPIIQPPSFKALQVLPFQINPHYLNQKQEGHNGETRDQRLEEFAVLNPGVPVVGIPEGTALQLQQNRLLYIGAKDGVLFCGEQNGTVQKRTIKIGEDLSLLMQAQI